MPSGKGSKLLRYIEHRLRVTLFDGRQIVGTFLAFDKHLNLVLSESEEYRATKKQAAILEERTEKRVLGLVLIRGENVVSLAVEGPPPNDNASKAKTMVGGGGPGQVTTGVGRGSVVPPMGLGAVPIHGVVGMPPGVGRGMPPPY